MTIIGIVPSSEINESNGFRLDASYYLNKKIKCSLCDTEFSKFDIDIDKRKKRHEEKHTRGWNYKAQRNGGGNNTIGKVIWEDVADE